MNSSPHSTSAYARPARSLLAALLSVVALAAPGVAAPQGLTADAPPQRDVLLNGLRVVTVQRPGGRAAVVCAIRAGAMFDPAGKSGLANVTAGALTRGAGSYDAARIQGELDDAGAKLTVRADWDATWIEAEGPAASVPVVLEIIGLMVTAPRFAAEDVEAIKKLAAAQAAEARSSAAGVADRRFASSLYGTHTYGRDVWGDPESIASITAGDVKVFYDRFYAANAAVIAVCGAVSGEQVASAAKARFGRWQKKPIVPATFLPPTPATSTKVVVVDGPAGGRAVVRAGFMAPGRSDPSAATVKVLAERLQKELEARLSGASDVAVRHDLRTLQSPFVVSYSVATSGLEASLSDLSEALAAMQSAPQPAAAASTRLYFIKTSDSCADEARAVASSEFFAGQKLAPDPVNYRVDEASVSAAARSVLKPAALTIVVVGEAAEIERSLKGKYPIEVAAGL